MYKLKRFLSSDDKFQVSVYQLLGILSSVRRGQIGRFNPVYKRYRRYLSHVKDSPYPFIVYLNLLELLENQLKDFVMPLTEVKLEKRKAIILRHDIDQPMCIENMSCFAEAEQRHGFKSSCLALFHFMWVSIVFLNCNIGISIKESLRSNIYMGFQGMGRKA